MKELETIQELTDCFSKLPGIGVKSAERMAYAVLAMKSEQRESFVHAFRSAEEKVKRCPRCGMYIEGPTCPICDDPERDRSLLCVVSEIKDALAIERMDSYKGLYHILGGVISISKGLGMERLNVDSLIAHIDEGEVKEVILATNPTLDGETTAMFVHKLLEDKHVTVTRLGYGLPMGSSLDYADRLTLSKAFEGRKAL